MDDNYYRVLQISSSATQREIKVAYRKLVQTHHPDVTNSSDEEYIKIINIAYETLSNPVKKIQYDRSLQDGYTAVGKPFSSTSTYPYRSRRRPPPYFYRRSSQTNTYTFSLKTQIIGWMATIFVLLFVAFSIWALHYYTSEYYYEEGLVAEKNKDLEEALHLFQMAIRDWGNKNVEASIKSAELTKQLGAFHYMVDYCKKGLSSDPDSLQSARLFYLEGTAYYKTQRYEKAEIAFLNSLKFNFNKDTIYNLLGWIYINNLEQYDKAEEIYSFLLAGNSINLANYYNRGISYQYLGEHEKAIEDFLIVLEDNPYHGKTLFQLGRSHLSLGQKEQACYYLRFSEKQSVNIDPADLAKACD